MKHFKIQELVPKAMIDEIGEEACWSLLKGRLKEALEGLYEFLTEHFGKVSIVVNDWSWGGGNQYRGYRPPDCEIGAKSSEHKKGNACDCTVIRKSDNKVIPATEIRQLILDNENDPRLLNIMRLESNVPWVHFDCKEIPIHERISVFKP